MVKQISWDVLKLKEQDLPSGWRMNPNQSHLVYPHMKEEFIENEYIYYGWCDYFDQTIIHQLFLHKKLANSCLETLSPSFDAASTIKLTSFSVKSSLNFLISYRSYFLLMNSVLSVSMALKISSKWENLIQLILPWWHLSWNKKWTIFHPWFFCSLVSFWSYSRRWCIQHLSCHLTIKVLTLHLQKVIFDIFQVNSECSTSRGHLNFECIEDFHQSISIHGWRPFAHHDIDNMKLI